VTPDQPDSAFLSGNADAHLDRCSKSEIIGRSISIEDIRHISILAHKK